MVFIIFCLLSKNQADLLSSYILLLDEPNLNLYDFVQADF